MKSVRKFLTVVLVILGTTTFAQQEGKGKLAGSVVDSLSGSPLEYASVTLIEQTSSKTINGGVTDKAGQFSLTGIKGGTYVLLVEFIGYLPAKRENILIDESKGSIELRPFVLSPRPNALQAVTVTTTGKLVTNKIDKLIYNAERDLTSQSGSATDVLRKVPQVSVDVNGNVELAGSSSIRFLINGKPSTAFGNSVSDVLQNIPASQIKSIEVVTNPGAKYDAQGLGGIINIVLKQNNAQGINGNVSATAGTRVSNGSFNFNARKGTFGVNAFVSGNYRPAFDVPVTTDRNSSDTSAKTMGLLHQDGVSHFSRSGFQTGASFDWSPNRKNNFDGSFDYERFGNDGHGFIAQRQQLLNQTTNAVVSDATTESFTNSQFWMNAIDVSLGYKRTFDKEDQELEIAINSSFGKSRISNDNYQLQVPSLKRFYGNRSSNPGKENETELTIDYTQPLKEDVTFGVGGKHA
ncbi:MAG: TonB-dependent receptor [Chitinophagaceae bacterium]|nr:MAG: TonB-dependent receptor [Chitinophagaceae bacterium]